MTGLARDLHAGGREIETPTNQDKLRDGGEGGSGGGFCICEGGLESVDLKPRSKRAGKERGWREVWNRGMTPSDIVYVEEYNGAILAAPTVLVLGAGASQEYGFPLGSELKSRMLHSLNGWVQGLLRKMGFENSLLQEFQDALRYSYHPTIDIFLEHKRNFRELGSYLIASTIGPLEVAGNLFPQRGWYGELFEALRFDRTHPNTGLLGVVSLNYDRSLEHFLVKNIDYNISHDCLAQAHDKRRRIRIVHAHGSLGTYPDKPYGTKRFDEAGLRSAAASIRIVSDRLEDSQDFQQAQDLIGWAQHVVFLGFGYDEWTLRSLLAKSARARTHYYGTAFNLPDEIIGRVKKFFDNNIVLGGHGQNCALFLQRTGSTLGLFRSKG